MKAVSGILLLLSLLGASSALFAENDQTYVIGTNGGLHSFSGKDDLRNGAFLDRLSGASDLYFEWYAFEELGVGLRLNALGATETMVSSFSSYQKELSVTNTFVTLNWIPIGATSYTRFGLLAGIGRSNYEYTESTSGSTNTNLHATSDGPATMLGGFVDWGAEDFGARFSYNLLNTDLANVGSNQVDASGSYWAFAIRWAFK